MIASGVCLIREHRIFIERMVENLSITSRVVFSLNTFIQDLHEQMDSHSLF